MAWTQGKISLPRKDSSDKFEASYLNGVLGKIEKFLNELADAQTVYEASEIHRVLGIAYLPPGEDQERYARLLDEDSFSVKYNPDEILEKRYVIEAKDAFNQAEAPYYDKDVENSASAWYNLKKLVDTYNYDLANAKNNPELMDTIIEGITNRFLTELSDFLRETFRTLIETEKFEFQD
jgi:hypothetical protein